MNIVEKIKFFLQQAELYRTQGLLDESKESYESAVKVIQENRDVKGADGLLKKIELKLKTLKETMEKIDQAPITPEMEAAVQDLIKDKFSFATDEHEKEFEGAMALSKFGQSERAIKEFEKLLNVDSHRMVSAKNIIRCYMSIDSVDEAVSEYEKWLSLDVFSPDELDNIRVFLQSFLNKKGIDRTLPSAEEPLEIEVPEIEIEETPTVEKEPASIEIPGIEIPEAADEGIREEDLTDVSSIGITLDKGPLKDKLIEVEVNLLQGTEITVIIAEKQKDLIEALKTGIKLENVQFYTPFAMFAGACVVESNTKIKTGPKRGDHSVDLKVA
jgi:tetratricopeptide (TPR) repeat protein